MKKLLIFFFHLFFYAQFLSGQNPLVKQWDHRYGGTFFDGPSVMIPVRDGGFLLGGTSGSGVGGDKTSPLIGVTDYWIVKTDSSGTFQWDKDFGGIKSDLFRAGCQTSDGGFLLGGFSYSDSSGDKSQNRKGGLKNDFWVIKTDSAGNKQWDRTFGGNLEDELHCLVQTNDGGYLLGGISESGIGFDKSQNCRGNRDYWIVKIDAFGIIQWDRTYGGAMNDYLYSICQTSDNGFILGGHSNSGVGYEKTSPVWGSADFWIIKVDSVGNIQWDSDIGGMEPDLLQVILPVKSNCYVIGGITSSGPGGNKISMNHDTSLITYDYWLVKVDSLGNMLWENSIGAPGDEDRIDYLIQTSDEGFLLLGSSSSLAGGDKSENNMGPQQMWMVKTDSSGNCLWDKTILTACTVWGDQSASVMEGKNGSFYFAGCSDAGVSGEKSEDCRGLWDYWILKYNDTTWTYYGTMLISSDTSFCDKQYIDFFDLSTNNPSSWQWFFPGGTPSSSTLQNPTGIYYNTFGSFDVTLIACNAAGCDTLFLPNFINEFPNPPVPTITWNADTLLSSPAFSYQWYDANGIIPGATGQYYVYQQPGNYYVVITDSNGCASTSFAVYTGIEDILNAGGINITPNPSNGNFILSGAPVNATLTIYDVAGRVVFYGMTKSSPEQFQLKAQEGMYFMEIISGNKSGRIKIFLKN